MNEQPFQLLHGDCLELMREIPEKSVDMILCDIPYGEVSQKSGGLRRLDRGLADRCEIDLEELCFQYTRICRGTVYIFCGTEQISRLVGSLRRSKFSMRVGAWNKTNPSPMNGSRMWLSGLEFCVVGRLENSTFNEHCKKALWDAPSGRAKIHPTEKPLALFERLVKASSNEGDMVLDNCMGSGTTGVACLNTGRKFIGMEMDENYFTKAKERIEKRLAELNRPKPIAPQMELVIP
jgi:DNA modification methylase